MIVFPATPIPGDTFQSGGLAWVWDGTKWIPDLGAAVGIPPGLYLPIAGGIMTGPLVLDADPINPLDASTKEYVDNQLTGGGSFLPTSGGTMNGPLVLNDTLVPSSIIGITGTNTNDNAQAGAVGQISTNSATAGISIQSGIPTNIIGVTLTPGDWDIDGEIWFNWSTSNMMPTLIQAGINPNIIAIPNAPGPGVSRMSMPLNFAVNSFAVLSLRPCRASLSIPTPYYLIGHANFPSGTVTVTGNILARRAR
jgi:hypothetical protein